MEASEKHNRRQSMHVRQKSIFIHPASETDKPHLLVQTDSPTSQRLKQKAVSFTNLDHPDLKTPTFEALRKSRLVLTPSQVGNVESLTGSITSRFGERLSTLYNISSESNISFYFRQDPEASQQIDSDAQRFRNDEQLFSFENRGMRVYISRFGPVSVLTKCTYCNVEVQTVVHFEINDDSFITSLVLKIIEGLCGTVYIPAWVSQDLVHRCQYCKTELARIVLRR